MLRAFSAMLAVVFLLTSAHLDRIEVHAAENLTPYGVQSLNLSDFIYFEYKPTVSGSNYHFYGAAMTINWNLPDSAREGNYFDLTLPEEIHFDAAPSSTRVFTEIYGQGEHAGHRILDVYLINDRTLRFVVTSYANEHTSISGTAILGEELDKSKIQGNTSYNAGRLNGADGLSSRVFSGFRPNKKLLKDPNNHDVHHNKFKKTLTYTTQYQGGEPRTLSDETSINYETEMWGDASFGERTVYAIKEDENYITWAVAYNSNDDRGRNNAVTFSGKGFFENGQRIPSVRVENIEDIKTYTGTFSGTTAPNDMTPTNEIRVETIEDGYEYKFNFPNDKPYYVEIKTRKEKKVKDPHNIDSYRAALKEGRTFHTYYTEEFYHPTTGFGTGAGVERPMPTPPAPIGGNVYVRHITIENRKIVDLQDQETIKENAPIGEAYTTSSKVFPGYRFSRVAGNSAPTSGSVSEADQTVIYVYDKIKGNVDVKYVTEDGRELEGVTPVKENAPVGEAYTTEQKTFAGYRFKEMANDSAPARGTVTEGDQHVVYVYEQVKGNVDVKYVTEDGRELEGVTPVKENAPVGEAYTTEQKTFDGYRFKEMANDSAPARGTVTEGDQHVVYVYEQIKGNVDVKYVTEDGRELEGVTPVKEDAPVGEAYTTEQKTFAGYRFKEMANDSAPARGTVTEGDQHVVYVYEQVKGNVDVKYVTEDGRELEGVTPVKEDAPVGEEYTTEQKTFDGYRFKEMANDSAPARGTVTEGDQHVVYVYEQVKGNVDVKYVTEDGRELEGVTPVKEDAPVGEEYTTKQKEFTGYRFKKMADDSAPARGTVTEGDQHVVYVYEQVKGNVDVKYVTEDGRELEGVTPVKEDAPVGEAYTTEQKTFDGYRFKEMANDSAPARGTVTEGDQHVVYVYEQVKGNVDVKYVTADGRELEGVTPVKENAPVGEEYTTEQKTFDGYRFKEMANDSAPARGTVTEGDQHVVYVYEQVKGNVDVKYVTEDGRELEGVTPVKENAPVGEAYTTEQKTFAGYRFKEMANDSAPARGTVTEGNQHVVYVYEQADPEEENTPEEPGVNPPSNGGENTTPANPQAETEQPKGTVVVTYEDENGNKIPNYPETTVKENVPVGENYTTTPPEIPGYRFVKRKESSAPREGKVVEGRTTVTYVYKQIKGNVDVKYVTADGRELEGVTPVKENAPVGDAYTTEQKEFTGYRFKEMANDSAPARGTVTEGDQHVVYVYEQADPEEEEEENTPEEPGVNPPSNGGENTTPENPPAETEQPKGTVVVTYEDENGNKIPNYPETTVKEDVPVGENYTTTPPEIPGYRFVKRKESSAPREGKVVEGRTTVTYVYKQIKGNVDVKYVTADGRELEGVTPVKENAPVGEEYTTEQKTFDGYRFKKMANDSAPARGTVTEGDQHVVYVYEQADSEEEEEENTPEEPGVNPPSNGGENTTPANPPAETEQPKGTVVVTYEDENGNKIPNYPETTVKEDVPVGENYKTTPPEIPGYRFVKRKESSAPGEGKVVEGRTTVTYVYKQIKGNVDVKYVTENGRELEGVRPIKENASVGEAYATEQKAFAGYRFKRMADESAPARGTVTEGDQHVVYVYEMEEKITPPASDPNLPNQNRKESRIHQPLHPEEIKQYGNRMKAPKTGDINDVFSYAALADVSLMMMAVLVFLRSKRKNRR